MFSDTGVVFTPEGKRHLGYAIGSSSFVECYVEEKGSDWKKELEHLSKIAIPQPQAAYAALTHGIVSKWTFLAKATPNMHSALLEPLEEVITHKFLPAILLTKMLSVNQVNFECRWSCAC